MRISWKRSTLTLNTRTNESRIKLSESSIIIAICSKTFNSENMSYTISLSSKCQSSRSRRSRSLIRIHKENILKMSEKMSNINESINISRSINRLINQSQSIRSIKSVNQLINRHQSFRHRHQLFRFHSDKHFFNHHILNHYILDCHTIYSTLQSISSIIRTINHSTNQSINTHFSNHFDHRTSAIKFDLSRKHLNQIYHLNRIYLNQFNHLNLHLHLNYRNYLNHIHSHQHLNSLQNQFNSINRTFRMIDSDN